MDRRDHQLNKETKLHGVRSVDIVTPTLNAAQYLDVCLQSTKCLRNRTVYHVIVDSDSKDETAKIASAHNVPIIYHPPGNMYAAINRGISETRSEWLTYLNSDDVIYPDSFDSLIETMGDDYDIIYGNTDFIDEEGRPLFRWKSADISSFSGLFASNVMPFPQQGVLFRRALWERLGGFNEKFMYAGDFDFFLRAFASGARFGYFAGSPTAAFRLHGSQISQNFASLMQFEGHVAYADSELTSSFVERLVARLRMRARNVSSYVARFSNLVDRVPRRFLID